MIQPYTGALLFIYACNSLKKTIVILLRFKLICAQSIFMTELLSVTLQTAQLISFCIKLKQ